MVGDGDEGPPESLCGYDHLVERHRSVAVRRVHLKVGTGERLPRRVRVQGGSNLRIREEPSPRLFNVGDGRRTREPGLDLRRDPRPDGAKLGQGSAGGGHVVDLFRPEPRGPRGAFQRPPAVVDLVSARPPEQLTDVRVGKHVAFYAASVTAKSLQRSGTPLSECSPRSANPKRDPRTRS